MYDHRYYTQGEMKKRNLSNTHIIIKLYEEFYTAFYTHLIPLYHRYSILLKSERPHLHFPTILHQEVNCGLYLTDTKKEKPEKQKTQIPGQEKAATC